MKRSSIPRRFKCWWLMGTLACLALAAPASASYLHVSQVLPRAKQFVAADARYQQASSSQFGRCWHNGPHVVECDYILQGVSVIEANEQGIVVVPASDILDPSAPVPPSHWLLIAVERRGHLHLHAE